jgi:hypothetical protein
MEAGMEAGSLAGIEAEVEKRKWSSCFFGEHDA